jgi:hypothetical protein
MGAGMVLAVVGGMRSEPDDDLATCLDCRWQVPPEDRVYAVGCEDVLCLECALRRRGRYDESEDRWIVAPSVADLLASAEVVGQ